MDLIKFVEKEYLKAELPSFKAGDKVTIMGENYEAGKNTNIVFATHAPLSTH